MKTGPTLPPTGLSPLEPEDPRAVGPYRLVGRIGEGGMGAVYGALAPDGRCVAVKTVHADIALRPPFREAFAREVAMLARAGGVSTARLHDHEIRTRVPWLAFDYVPGRDLRAHVREFGPLKGEMLRVFALGVAEGLSALHAAGVAHRDIKPGNVVLSPDGPKIVDFGIAAEIGTERSEDTTAAYGTPGWVAPERYAGAVADPAADVFAWGGLVTMAATGRAPFGDGDASELSRRVHEGAHDVAGVPEDLLGPVEASLSVAPDRRPSADDLVRSLLPGTESGKQRPAEVADILRGMLRDYWRGVDGAGHDPTRWAAALGTASAAGLGVSALGGGTLGSAGAGSTGGTVSAGVSGTSSGGFLSGLAGSKFVASSVGALAVAGTAAGGYALFDQVRPSPEDTIAAAVSVLEEGQGFTAAVERTSVDGGGTIIEEYLYSAADRSFLIRGEAMGEGTVAAANHRDELYVYGPYRDPEEQGWDYEPDHIELDAGIDEQVLGLALVTGPLESMVVDGEVETVQDGAGDGRTVHSGPANVLQIVDGAPVEEEMVGSVELTAENVPVRVSYTSESWEITIEFSDVGTAPEVLDPQLSEPWSVVHGPVCGRLDDFAYRDWNVRADGWVMGCADTMEVIDVMFGGESTGDHPRAEPLPAHSGSGTSTHLIDDTFTCTAMRVHHDVEPFGGQDWRPFPCRHAKPTDEEILPGHVVYEFEEAHLIDFVEVT